MLQRPTKSAANKYRHMMPGAIAEEIDYTMSNTNIMLGNQHYQQMAGDHQTLLTDDLDSLEHGGIR